MNWVLFVTGLVVHLTFFYSIFDIYFTSPLVHGMTPHHGRLAAPAKRIVLFVADGLRADKLFEVHDNGRTYSPYLRGKIEHDGCWGVSHTRVPTESRPGHVALIAGFYEDVSAVAKGWKENPVEFDSVFNESRHTWSWGSPDILPMFSKGATGNHVSIHMYPGHSEDFAGADMTKLDTWVFDKVKEFFEKAKQDDALNRMLNQDKLVFFLHLLGLDTTGHVKKPQSMEYLENIRVVDHGVEQTVKLIDDFFGHDLQTAYLFTSDHGMTDWGSHGASHPSETLTPLVCWGAGLREAQSPGGDGSQVDEWQRKWNLGHVKRSDVNQADVSSLMSVLIGVPIPLQSVGSVPLDYLGSSVEFKAESIFQNALQILEQFEVKMQQVQNTTFTVLYTPFKDLMPSDQTNEVRMIRRLISEKNFDVAISRSKRLIQLALDGLIYFHRYDRFFLGMSITSGFVGWMVYVLILLVSGHTNIVNTYSKANNGTRTNKKITYAFIFVATVTALLLYAQSLRWSYYIYTLIPLVLWHQVLQRVRVLRLLVWYVADHQLSVEVFTGVVLGFVGLELIILSFFFRELMSIGLLLIAFWPLHRSLLGADKISSIVWSLSCLFTAVFPLLPVMGKSSNYHLVYLAGIFSAVVAIVISFQTEVFASPKQNTHSSVTQSKLLVIVQVALVCLSIYVVWDTIQSREAGSGLPLLNQCFSWIITVFAFLFPLLSSSRVLPRLLTITLSLLPPYLLLSTSHEGLFFVALCVLLVSWIQMEFHPQLTAFHKLLLLDFNEVVSLGHAQRKLESSDLRRSYFFIFFLLLAFFGTGNIVSINSFDPTSVLCFVTIFNPFVMGALMLMKILIPFLLVTCAFNAIHLAVNVPTQSLSLLVLLISDFMALHFFFLVKDYGSWLEIGTSISHYVVVMSMIFFLFLLLAVSKFFTNCTVSSRLLHWNKSHEQ